MNNSWKKYTEADFRSAIQNSRSIAEALRTLNIESYGGNYSTAKRYIKKLSLDTSHMTGKGWLKGKTHSNKNPCTIPLEQILVKDSDYAGGFHRLKSRLFRADILKEECSECGLREWRGKKLSLELDHKNGNRTDNRKENLRILCPNCHSQTPTYRGRNKRKKQILPVNIAEIAKVLQNSCLYCKSLHDGKGKFCSVKCSNQFYGKQRMGTGSKIDWPPVEQLRSMIDELGYSATGRKLSVSDNAIRKHLKIR